MALQLNTPQMVYKEFYGRTIDMMPQLLAEGRTPISVQGLMQRRLEVASSPHEDLQKAWLCNYFDTGDAVALSPNGTMKINLDSAYIKTVHPKSTLLNGGLVLSDEAYAKLEGPEFKSKDLAKYAGRPFQNQELVENPIWNALARDPKLLKEYATLIFTLAKKEYGYDKNMGLYLGAPQDVPTLRLWVVGRLGNRGVSDGYYILGNYDGRLVGVAPEAQSARVKQKKGSLEAQVE